MAGTKVTRLNKAAREFNIGRDTIVEFLGKKGYEIDPSPHTKLTSEMVALLTDEYSDEKSVKEEARKKGLGGVKRETISLDDRKKPEPEPEDYEEEKDIIIRGVSVKVDESFKRAVEPHFDSKPSPKKKAKEIAETKTQPASEAPPEQAEIETPVSTQESPQDDKVPESATVSDSQHEVHAESASADQQKKAKKAKDEKDKLDEIPDLSMDAPEVKPAQEISEKPSSPELEIASPKVEDEKKKTGESVKGEPSVEKSAKKSESTSKPEALPEKEQVQAVVDQDIEAKTEETEKEVDIKSVDEKGDSDVKEPRVLGKIDLSTINERTKPPRKTAAEKRKEKEDRKKTTQRKPAKAEEPSKKPVDKKPESKPQAKAEQPSPTATKKPVEAAPVEDAKAETTHANQNADNFLKTKVEKLVGPNIIGKIELPVEKKFEKKKPVASSSDDKVKPKRKKRKRIRKDVPAKDGATTTTDNKQKKTDDKGRGRSKPKPPTRGRRGREAKPELTEEEVQKQIKETLARLSGTGKSKASKYRRQKRDLVHKQKEQDAIEKEEDKKNLIVVEFVTANELATMMNVAVTEVISVCMQLGLFVSINQRLDAETITLVSEEFGFNVAFETAEIALDTQEEEADKPEDLEFRSPIATVMGHVDHGKTKLLDYIRSANVVAGEAGGITQHIGAYEVVLENGKKITFLDTPGHEAFTAMRARGAKVTDVAIIVIAADDSVMPQTVEAINHAQAANVPIVFAINKIDKPTANVDRIKDQLSQMNVLVEDWGGKYQSQEISAKNGINIDELLEKVLLESEMLDLKANPNRNANGTIIESSLDKGRGYVAKLLVQNGSLKVGDLVLAGSHYGRVKAMYNERNQIIKIAGPSAPVLMLGMNGAPQAGDSFRVMDDEREAKNIASKRMQLHREQGLRTQKHVTLDEIGRRIAIGDFKELNIIVKGDVDGSVEALSDSLIKLGTEEVQVNVIHKSVGQVTETDVLLASASNAIIVAFQVRPSVGARKIAEKEQIDIRTYSIIYAAIEEIKAAIEGMLSPDIEEKIICNIEVREVFKITKVGTIAGCYVLDGTVHRNTRIRVIRDGIVIHTGKLGSLKRFKDDVREVHSGYECGLNIDNFNDIKVGDIIEGFEEVKVARKLD